MARMEVRVSDVEKSAWKKQAKRDGFSELGPWIRWLANLKSGFKN